MDKINIWHEAVRKWKEYDMVKNLRESVKVRSHLMATERSVDTTCQENKRNHISSLRRFCIHGERRCFHFIF